MRPWSERSRRQMNGTWIKNASWSEGASGGGGLAAGVALMARDRGEIDLFAQCLIYPMLDDHNITASSQQFVEP